jgi:hypothetical protein
MKDKDKELNTDVYKAETDRIKAVGSIDPVALQMVVRQMVSDMLQTDVLHPQLMQHAQQESEIQQTLAPPQPEGADADQGAPQQ